MRATFLAYWLCVCVMATSTATAQAPAPDCKPQQHPHKPNPEMRAALKKHFQEQMYPVLKEKHQQFDAALSATDLKFLNDKRQYASQLRDEKEALHKQGRQYHQSGKTHDEVKAIMHPQMEQLRGKKEALFAEMEPFIQRNNNLINKFVEELKPYHEQWREQRHAIKEQYRPEDAPPPANKDAKCDKPEGKGRGNHAHSTQDKTKHRIIRFLLWNGEEPEEPHHHHHHPDGNNDAPPQNRNTGSGSDALLPNKSSQTLALFPNPAMDNINLKFGLEAAATEVSVKILDNNGRVVRETSLGAFSAGNHTTAIQVQDLPAGQYFCLLNANGNQQTQPFVIRR